MTSAVPRLRARDLGLVFAGGVGGTAARLAVTLMVGADAGLALVNLLGAFLLGTLTAVLTRTVSARHQRAHLLLGTGALGGFTTYSALALAAIDYDGLIVAALIAVGGVVAATVGYALGGGFGRRGVARGAARGSE